MQSYTRVDTCTTVTKALLDNNFQTLRSNFSGTSFPTSPVGGQFFVHTGTSPWTLHMYNSTLAAWVAVTTLTLSADPIVQFMSDLALANNIAKGADLVGYRGRTVHDRLDDAVWARDYGIVPDTTDDQTTAINNLLTNVLYARKPIVFSSGTYRYRGGGVLGEGCTIMGMGKGTTIFDIREASPIDGYVFKALGGWSGVRGCKFIDGVTQTGGTWIWLFGQETFADDIYLDGDYNGIWMTGNVARIRHCRFQDGASGAIRIKAEGGDNSQLIDDVLMGAQSTQLSAAGIRVRNSGALIISNTSVIQQGTNLLIDPTTNTLSSDKADGGVYSLYVDNCFFDNAGDTNIKINPTGNAVVVRSRFSNTWAGSASNDGILLDNDSSGGIQGIYFESPHIVLNGSRGLRTSGVIGGLHINGGIVAQNASHGIELTSGTVNSAIRGATIGSGGGMLGNGGDGVKCSDTANIAITSNYVINNTGVGVNMTGTSDGYMITDNYVSGNSGGRIVTTTTNIRVVKDNLGNNIYTPDVAQGAGRISTASTSVVITHGLGVAPLAGDIIIWPHDGWSSMTPYLDTTSITATQFTVRCPANAPYNLDFGWKAWLHRR